MMSISKNAPVFNQKLCGENPSTIVNEQLLLKKIKKTCSAAGLISIKKGAVSMLQSGVIEYLRLCLEELIDTSKVARQFNGIVNKNSQSGQL